MAFNAKLVIRDEYNEEIIDLVQVAINVNMGDISNDIEIVEGSRFQSATSGIGTLTVGRVASFGIPIFEKKSNGQIEKMESQYVKYTSTIMSTGIKRYFLRINYEDEVYEAEYALISVSGYNITWIKNMGIITIELKAIDKAFFRQELDTYELALDENAEYRQDITYISKSYVPTPVYFSMEFDIVGENLEFIFANRKNFGISFKNSIDSTKAFVEFNGEVLKVNGLAYDFKGIAPELNPNQNVFYLEYNQVIRKLYISYKRGVLI